MNSPTNNHCRNTPAAPAPAPSSTTPCTVFTSPCIESCQVTEEQRQEVVMDHHRLAAAKAAASEGATPKKGCELAEQCVSSCAAYGRVCPCSARIAAHAACKSIRELMQDSHIFGTSKNTKNSTNNSNDNNSSSDKNSDNTNNEISYEPPDFPFVNAEDIIIREKLGEGGFSSVNACSIIVRTPPKQIANNDESKEIGNLIDTDDYLTNEEEKDCNNHVGNEKSGGNDEEPEYAIKYLKKRSMVDLHTFKHGAADLAVEAL